ncbi:MAG: glycosyltransferase family 4 protein [Bacteroidales bacterium]|nr:glycosyltransferase family 4 protein [Bacteroidales bacterium]
MNILFVTIAWPKKGNTNLYSDLFGEFKDKGNNVYVLHGEASNIKKAYQREIIDDIEIIRVKTGKIAKAGPVRKFISLMTLNRKMNSAFRGEYKSINFDLIIFATPPITLSRFLNKLKKRNQARLYLLLKDIWPYGMADLGVIRNKGLIWRYFRRHEKRIYRIADHIGCMSPMGVEFIRERNPEIPATKIEVCPNAIRIPEVSRKKDSVIRGKYKIPQEATVFLFSGNLGKGHGLYFLVRNIIALSNYKKAFFLIGGNGTHFRKVQSELDTVGISNAMVYDYLPQKDFESLIATCNVGLILLDKAYSYPQFPSRLLAYLKNKMAVLCAVNDNTDIGKIVVEHDCGLLVNHGDDIEFQNCVKNLAEDPDKVRSMGEKGWELLNSMYDVKEAYKIIMSHY